MIYLDNAATTWPKPEAVVKAMQKAIQEQGGNPGRSGHKLSLAAGKAIEKTRVLLTRLFNAPDPDRIVFTLNATEAINLGLKGILRPGDHVISGTMEHNAVARPLEALQERGIEVTKVRTSPQTGIDPGDVRTAIKSNTKMVALGHASNVTGTINSVGEVGRLCRERGIVFLVDAAQTAGYFPINVQDMCIDLLAFPGHKGLLGPQGTGGLYISSDVSPLPLREGGTGSDSQSLIQPTQSPDRYESGTPNTPGIAGLAAGVAFILEQGTENIRAREHTLVERLLTGLKDIPGAVLYGPPPGAERAGAVSLNIGKLDPLEVAVILDQAFDIAVRSGLHCAPDAHREIGTLNRGTIRISPGFFNSEEDIDGCLAALDSIAQDSIS
jgi:cysteine desulfurase family protein